MHTPRGYFRVGPLGPLQGGFSFWPRASPGLPRAGCLAIWPGAPGAKKKAVLDLPTKVYKDIKVFKESSRVRLSNLIGYILRLGLDSPIK